MDDIKLKRQILDELKPGEKISLADLQRQAHERRAALAHAEAEMKRADRADDALAEMRIERDAALARAEMAEARVAELEAELAAVKAAAEEDGRGA